MAGRLEQIWPWTVRFWPRRFFHRWVGHLGRPRTRNGTRITQHTLGGVRGSGLTLIPSLGPFGERRGKGREPSLI